MQFCAQVAKRTRIFVAGCDSYLAPVVRKVDSTIHRINLYPVDKY